MKLLKIGIAFFLTSTLMSGCPDKPASTPEFVMTGFRDSNGIRQGALTECGQNAFWIPPERNNRNAFRNLTITLNHDPWNVIHFEFNGVEAQKSSSSVNYTESEMRSLRTSKAVYYSLNSEYDIDDRGFQTIAYDLAIGNGHNDAGFLKIWTEVRNPSENTTNQLISDTISITLATIARDPENTFNRGVFITSMFDAYPEEVEEGEAITFDWEAVSHATVVLKGPNNLRETFTGNGSYTASAPCLRGNDDEKDFLYEIIAHVGTCNALLEIRNRKIKVKKGIRSSNIEFKLTDLNGVTSGQFYEESAVTLEWNIPNARNITIRGPGINGSHQTTTERGSVNVTLPRLGDDAFINTQCNQTFDYIIEATGISGHCNVTETTERPITIVPRVTRTFDYEPGINCSERDKCTPSYTICARDRAHADRLMKFFTTQQNCGCSYVFVPRGF